MDPLTTLAGVLILAGLYYVSVRVHPFTNCSRCRGGGRNAGSTKRRFGTCGKCGGSGKRRRLGARLFFRNR